MAKSSHDDDAAQKSNESMQPRVEAKYKILAFVQIVQMANKNVGEAVESN
jgi:hypothetical protein